MLLRVLAAAFTSVLSLCVLAIPTVAGFAAPCLNSLTERDAAAIADPSGRVILSVNSGETHVPASTIKILTALTALQSLGPSYRFSTHLYLDSDANLFVKGTGDPMLTSEELREMAWTISEKIRLVGDVVVDHSYFSPVTIPGTGTSSRSYNAPVGALSANFNTVRVTVGPGGKLLSAEPQTPLLPYAATRLARLGQVREGRHTFIHSAAESAIYAGELLAYFLRQKGVEMTGRVTTGTVPADSTPLLTWHSPFTIEEVIERMMEFSNNFIANQLFLAAGAMELGPPADLRKALEVMGGVASGQLGLASAVITEGSGLSRENRISAEDMLILLQKFAPYRYLLKEEFGIPYKTGTLRGMRTRAGYLESGSGKHYPFALFINEDIEKTDHILRCLARGAGALP